MTKKWMILAALMLGLSAPVALHAQFKGDDGVKKEGEAKKDDAKDGEEAERPELPESDAKAKAALKGAYDKMYSPRAKGMKKLWGKMELKSEFTMAMGGQEMKMEDTVNYDFVWNGEDPTAVKSKTEPTQDFTKRALRQGLKQQAEGMGKFIDMFIGLNSFADTFKEDDCAFAFKDQSDEEKKAKIQRILVTSINEDNKLEENTYHLKEGLLASIPSGGVDMKVEWVKKGRNYFLKAAGMETGNGRGAVKLGYEFSKIKKAGKYSMPTVIKVDTKMGVGSGTTTITLSDFKTDKKVTQKMIDEIIPPETDEDIGVEEVKDDGKKEEKKKGKDESPIEGVTKEQYDRIKGALKRINGKEPTDDEIKKAIEQWGGGGGRNGRNGRNGRRGR